MALFKFRCGANEPEYQMIAGASVEALLEWRDGGETLWNLCAARSNGRPNYRRQIQRGEYLRYFTAGSPRTMSIVRSALTHCCSRRVKAHAAELGH